MNRVLLLSLLSISLVATTIAPVQAETKLSRATILKVRNRVQLKPKGEKRRAAKLQDVLSLGDQLATGRSSFAEFQFNEGTAVRMGERAVFRFIPRSRNFLLNQGTALLLIPPGLGRSRVRTPSVQVGIRGSALFVRHNPDTNTTIVGALTSSGIEVSERADGPIQRLKAGQMAVAVDGEIQELYDFDLATFYETSALGEGVLQGQFGSKKVLQEIEAGLAQQGNFPSPGESKTQIVQTPDFVRLTPNPIETASTINLAQQKSPSTNVETLGLSIGGIVPETLPLEDGSAFPGASLGLPLIAETTPQDDSTPLGLGKSPNPSLVPASLPKPPTAPPHLGSPPVDAPLPNLPQTPNELPEVIPPTFQPPEIAPPEIEEPGFEPPEVELPEVEPPEIELPEIEEPGFEPPEVELPEVELPEVEPPEIELPDIELPDIQPPEIELPEIDPPEIELPDTELPALEPETDILDLSEVEVPEAPEAEVLEIETPEMPEVQLPPEPSIPETEISEIEIPEAPETEISDLEIPEMPEIEAPAEPEFSEPEMSEIEAPEVETPEVSEGLSPNGGFTAVATPITETDPGATGEFPGQGNGVTEGFPGQGTGVTDGFPGQNSIPASSPE